MKLFKKHTPYKYGKHSKCNKHIATPMKNYMINYNENMLKWLLWHERYHTEVKHNKNILIFGKSGIGKCTVVQEYIEGVK